MGINYTFDNLDTVLKQIDGYANDLKERTARFIELLSEIGIKVARDKTADGTHHMPERIRFEKEIEDDGKGYVICIITGTGEILPSRWRDSHGEEHDDSVFPLAMLEFGSAAFALEPQNAYGGYGGQGTFSESGNETKRVWYVTKIYDDGTEVGKRATAIRPTRPMYNAMVEMQTKIMECANTAYGR